jgi:hypothetical protein
MRPTSRFLRFWLGALVAIAMVGGACGGHHAYRVYDPYYNDYHVWSAGELDYYHRWANEYHRDPNRDFRKLPPEEQKEYWTWRHTHGREADRH